MKCLFVTFLTIAAVSAQDLICQPGLLFKMDCNSCVCGRNGLTAACTDMLCPGEANSENGPTEPAGNIYCTPGSFFKVDCNGCTCGSDGRSVACTDMLCPPEENNEADAESKKVCEPLSTFKDYCNNCTCASDGSSFACTRMACDPEIWNEDGTVKNCAESKRVARSAVKPVCKPRTQFKKYCNTCTCSADGSEYACTRMACDPRVWNEDGTVKIIAKPNRVARSAPKQVCEPRSVFKKDCNTCFCSNDGTVMGCTIMKCLPPGSIPKQVCEPRSQFKKYCNTCTCSADGTESACTRMACDPEVWNEDGSLRINDEHNRVTRSIPKQVCEPRSQFKKYCNTCTCSADGTQSACTRMACDPEVWNEDGSLRINDEHNRVTRSAAKQVCEPRSQFKKYCNTCTCSADGTQYACTRMACDPEIWNEDGTVKDTFEASKFLESNPKQVCKPQSQFKKYCNTCACSLDGTQYACTRMACDPEIWNEDGTKKDISESNELVEPSPKQVCEPKTQFKKYCNTCACSLDGTQYACTRMACDPEIWNEDGTKKDISESNKLVESSPKQVCEPRTQFKKYCNTCACSLDGTVYACTKMACDPEIWNEDGSLKFDSSRVTRSTPKQICQPGKRFSLDGCNICKCNEDGTNADCSRRFCPQ